MLTSILPGLREVRTPLSLGYLWLACAWAIFGGETARSRSPFGAMRTLWELGEYLGHGPLLGVATFVAYLTGSILEVNPQRLWQFGGRPDWITDTLNRWRASPAMKWLRFPALSATTEKDLLIAVFKRRSDVGQAEASQVFNTILGEVRQLATRLQAANADLFNKYDRLLAEATFRFNVAPALGVLVLIVVWGSGLNVVLALASTALLACAIVILLKQVAFRMAQANEVIAQALIVGIIESEAVKRAAVTAPDESDDADEHAGVVSA